MASFQMVAISSPNLGANRLGRESKAGNHRRGYASRVGRPERSLAAQMMELLLTSHESTLDP
jgi:hypothetical protein